MTETIKDKKGRSIEVEEVVGSAKSRLHMAMGRDLTDSPWALGSIARATVRAIDGKPMPPLFTGQAISIDQVHGLWDAVDEDAAVAAVDWLVERSKDTLADAGNSSGRLVGEIVSS